jgi:outer membrane protein assembly factor BamB
MSSPAIAHGVAYVGSNDGNLYAFDATGTTGCSGMPKTCTPLWTATGGGPSSPSVANGVVYTGSMNFQQTAFDAFAFDAAGATGCSGTPKTCTPLWTASTSTLSSGVASSIAIANGAVYVNSAALNAFGLPKTDPDRHRTADLAW